MKKISFIILLVAFCMNARSQVMFQKTYGGIYNEGKCFVVKTSDGGYAVEGSTQSFGAGDNDIYLFRTNQLGTLLWTKTYGGAGSDVALSIEQTNDDGFIVSGATTSFGAGGNDVYLIRTDMNGDTLWTKTFGNTLFDEGYSVKQTADSGFIVAGGYGSSGYDYLIKTNSMGDTLWTKIYDGGKVFSIIQNADGGYLLCGAVYSFQGGSVDMFLCRMNSSGTVMWFKMYGGNLTEYGLDVKATSDGGYIAIGHSSTFGEGNEDVYVVKTDSMGVLNWSKTYGGANYEMGNAVLPISDGYLLLGSVSFNTSSWETQLIKINNAGNVIWANNYTSGYGGRIQQTSDNGFIFSSYTINAYLTKTDSLGNSGCNFTAATLVDSIATTQVDSMIPTVSYGTLVDSPNTLVSGGGASTTLCLFTGINEATLVSKSFSIYPNPCSICEIKGVDNVNDLRITDVAGRNISVAFSKTPQGYKVQLPETCYGIYLIRNIRTGQVAKILKP